jgi:hypothetical protein
MDTEIENPASEAGLSKYEHDETITRVNVTECVTKLNQFFREKARKYRAPDGNGSWKALSKHSHSRVPGETGPKHREVHCSRLRGSVDTPVRPNGYFVAPFRKTDVNFIRPIDEWWPFEFDKSHLRNKSFSHPTTRGRIPPNGAPVFRGRARLTIRSSSAASSAIPSTATSSTTVSPVFTGLNVHPNRLGAGSTRPGRFAKSDYNYTADGRDA